MKNILKIMSVGISLALATPALADKPVKFSVLGTWASVPVFTDHEEPFWRDLSKNTGGKMIATIGSYSHMGLKGFEVMRLLKSGVFDYVHGLFGYVASENAVFEGPDLSAVAQDIGTERDVANAYFPILEKHFEKTFNAKLLQLYPSPSQIFYCREQINGIGDLKGKKIRVYSTTLGDFVEGVGGTSVTVGFGDVIPALEKGVVDCAITGISSAYASKWYQAANYVYPMRVGWGLSFGAINMDKWNSMSSAQQAELKKRISAMTDKTWKQIGEQENTYLECLTGKTCPYGPLGGMTLVKPSSADLAKREEIVKEYIVKRWAKRCDDTCVANWNKTIGKVLNITAAK